MRPTPQSRALRVLHLFSGMGGGALGFKDAGYECVGAIDNDPGACADFEALVGFRPLCADMRTLLPDELRAHCAHRPDVVFTSAPCQGLSRCLPAAKAATEHYQTLNALTLRGVWITLEAWKELPPPLILFENVPGIRTRGRAWLDQVVGLLHAYGYAVRETVHDCGVIGGLAQRRQRFLLVARHMAQVPEYLYVPPQQRLRGVGEVLGSLPVPYPGQKEGGPLHRLPEMSPMNWVRLALIPPGKDWRALPPSVALGQRPGRQNGGFGASPLRGAGAVIADPRVTCVRREGSMGVTGWDQPSTSVIAKGTHHNGPWQVADPRITHDSSKGNLGVCDWAQPSHCVIGDARAYKGANVADPRLPDQAIEGPALDLDSKRPCSLVIRAADGTWHRPMTTLELAVLQSFPVWHNGAWLELSKGTKEDHRARLGNAVPPRAAKAMARSCALTLKAAASGQLLLSAEDVWVQPIPLSQLPGFDHV